MSDFLPQRRNPRIKGYDYSQAGYYFVTICTKGRAEILSRIKGGKSFLTPIGTLVDAEWRRSELLRSEIELDAFIVMPNHLHCIVRIIQTSERPNAGRAHDHGLETRSLSSLITGFKSSVTKLLRVSGLFPESPWQRGYYEHIIKNEMELNKIREYILNNPARWLQDRENVEILKSRMMFVNGSTTPINLRRG